MGKNQPQRHREHRKKTKSKDTKTNLYHEGHEGTRRNTKKFDTLHFNPEGPEIKEIYHKHTQTQNLFAARPG
jgi:hypothetical protein